MSEYIVGSILLAIVFGLCGYGYIKYGDLR